MFKTSLVSTRILTIHGNESAVDLV
jgi:hypothetical protein